MARGFEQVVEEHRKYPTYVIPTKDIRDSGVLYFKTGSMYPIKEELKNDYVVGTEVVAEDWLLNKGCQLFQVFTEGGYFPQRSTKKSAGYDFSTPIDLTIPPKGYTKFFTNIKAYMEDDEVLKLYIRSSLGFKHGLMLANNTGIIDADYYSNPENDGNIGCCLYNSSDKELKFEAGTRIFQGIFQKYLVADDDNANKKRVGGLGSTGTQ